MFFAARLVPVRESEPHCLYRLGSPVLALPVLSDSEERWRQPCVCTCLITAGLYTQLGMVSPQLVDPFIHRRFNLCPRRFRVVFPPLGHPQHVLQSCAHLLHLGASFPFVLLRFHPFCFSPRLFSLFYHLPSLCKIMKHTRRR